MLHLGNSGTLNRIAMPEHLPLSSYKTGDLVWAKVRGNPVWPGQVRRVRHCHPGRIPQLKSDHAGFPLMLVVSDQIMDPASAPAAALRKRRAGAKLVAFFGRWSLVLVATALDISRRC